MLTKHQCIELLEQFHTPRHIVKHCLAVQKVALYLADKLIAKGITVNREVIEKAALVHDMVKVIDFKELKQDNYFEQPVSEDDKQCWRQLREKYKGQRHEDVAYEILKQFDPQVAEVVRKHKYSRLLELKGTYTWEEKVLFYADMCVNFDRIVLVAERIAQGQERNKHLPRTANSHDVFLEVVALEKEIFRILKISPQELLKLNTKPTRAILFDYNGVLINSFPITMLVYRTIADTFKLPKPKNAEGYRNLFESDWRAALRKMGVTQEKDIIYSEQTFKDISTHHREKLLLQPGTAPVLEKLKNHYQLAIVSNNFKEQISQRLSSLGIASYFTCIIDHTYGIKPDPRPIHACLDKLDIAADEAVLIGDMTGDIEAGKSARLKKIVGVTYGYHPAHKLSGADVLINHAEELLYVVE